jgi:hypothetical protein
MEAGFYGAPAGETGPGGKSTLARLSSRTAPCMSVAEPAQEFLKWKLVRRLRPERSGAKNKTRDPFPVSRDSMFLF